MSEKRQALVHPVIDCHADSGWQLPNNRGDPSLRDAENVLHLAGGHPIHLGHLGHGH
jgi:hypothetical protein